MSRYPLIEISQASGYSVYSTFPPKQWRTGGRYKFTYGPPEDVVVNGIIPKGYKRIFKDQQPVSHCEEKKFKEYAYFRRMFLREASLNITWHIPRLYTESTCASEDHKLVIQYLLSVANYMQRGFRVDDPKIKVIALIYQMMKTPWNYDANSAPGSMVFNSLITLIPVFKDQSDFTPVSETRFNQVIEPHLKEASTRKIIRQHKELMDRVESTKAGHSEHFRAKLKIVRDANLFNTLSTFTYMCDIRGIRCNSATRRIMETILSVLNYELFEDSSFDRREFTETVSWLANDYASKIVYPRTAYLK